MDVYLVLSVLILINRDIVDELFLNLSPKVWGHEALYILRRRRAVAGRRL